MIQVLQGIRVVEQGTFITGPCTGMMLADLGADVVKVESPGGDPYRAYQGGQFSPHFQAYNRNKRSVALDLGQAAERELFDELLSDADVYIQNFRPGTAERLGAGVERLQKLNPKLIYCSISGFGASGPYVDRPSYDSVAQALSGFLSVVVDRERPRFLGPALADAITGIYAAYGVLGALFERTRTGRGRHVSVSMLEAMAHFAVEPFAAYFALGEVPTSRDRPRLAQAHILHTADGGLLVIHLSSLEKFWDGLVSATRAERLRTDARFSTRLARIENYEALGAELDAIFSREPTGYWIRELASHDVPYAPIHGVDEVVDDPQVRHLGLMVPVDGAHGGKQAVRPPVQFDGERAERVLTAPLVNEHGAEIRRVLQAKLGWPAAQAAQSVARSTS
jgi:crotonobetainyl-CoA:carnitine CoA-transferase CaiB-like acyl-CoA transferase